MACLLVVAGAVVAPTATAGGSGRPAAVAAVPASCAHAGAARSAPAPTPPVGHGECPRIRPGDQLYAKLGTLYEYCVVGFIYRDHRGELYFSTGPQCAPPFAFDEPVTTWPKGKGPVAYDGPDGDPIGQFVFRTYDEDTSLGMSLVRVARNVAVDAQVCQFGGPLGVAEGQSRDVKQLVSVGPDFGWVGRGPEGITALDGTTARPAVAHHGFYDSGLVLVTGQAWIDQTGSPVLTADGLALGVMSDWYTANTSPGPGINYGIAVTRPHHPLLAARRALRTTFTMLTAPLL